MIDVDAFFDEILANICIDIFDKQRIFAVVVNEIDIGAFFDEKLANICTKAIFQRICDIGAGVYEQFGYL